MGKRPVHGKAPAYLTDLCQAVCDVSPMLHLICQLIPPGLTMPLAWDLQPQPFGIY